MKRDLPTHHENPRPRQGEEAGERVCFHKLGMPPLPMLSVGLLHNHDARSSSRGPMSTPGAFRRTTWSSVKLHPRLTNGTA